MDPSIDSLRASDGSGNASVATIQSVRAPEATTIDVDTVEGIPDNFFGTMGTPHTFVDPVTSETITVISEATAVDFRGHVDGSNLEIDEIAPGYTDEGSAVSDIVIIKPTTQWADNAAEVLEVSHNDDGTLKDDAVTTDVIADEAVTTAKVDDGAVTPAKRSGGFKIGSIAPSANGQASVTGIGFAPKYLEMFYTENSSDTHNTARGHYDGITQVAYGGRSAETGDSSSVLSTAAICFRPAANGTTDDLIAMDSLDADGFTYTKSDHQGTRTFYYIAYG